MLVIVTQEPPSPQFMSSKLPVSKPQNILSSGKSRMFGTGLVQSEPLEPAVRLAAGAFPWVVPDDVVIW